MSAVLDQITSEAKAFSNFDRQVPEVASRTEQLEREEKSIRSAIPFSNHECEEVGDHVFRELFENNTDTLNILLRATVAKNKDAAYAALEALVNKSVAAAAHMRVD